MNKSSVEHTLIVPPNYMAQIVGVSLIRVGPRKVWAVLQGGAEISIKRKTVETFINGDFMTLANKVVKQFLADKQPTVNDSCVPPLTQPKGQINMSACLELRRLVSNQQKSLGLVSEQHSISVVESLVAKKLRNSLTIDETAFYAVLQEKGFVCR
jgi:hypothetical protein